MIVTYSNSIPTFNIKTCFRYDRRILSAMLNHISSRVVRHSRILSALRTCIVGQPLYSHIMKENLIFAVSKDGNTFRSLRSPFEKKRARHFVRATAASRHFQNPDFQNRKYSFENKSSDNYFLHFSRSYTFSFALHTYVLHMS